MKSMAVAQMKCRYSERGVLMMKVANDPLHNSGEVATKDVGVIADRGAMMVRFTAELEVAVTWVGKLICVSAAWRFNTGS